MLAHEAQPLGDDSLEVSQQPVAHGLGGNVAELTGQPRLHVRQPAQVLRRHVHDAEARHGGWGCNLQVLHLEQHAHLHLELDALRVRQAQRHVVVQHCVHVLNPQRVNRAIEHRPHAVLRLRGDITPHDGGRETVGPLLRQLVELAVQLAHGNALRVQHVGVHHLEGLVLRSSVAKRRHGSGQRGVGGGLAASRRTHDDDAKPHRHGLVQLDDLLHHLGHALQATFLHHLLHRHLKVAHVLVRHLHAGEQVVDDAEEQRQVIRQELRHVAVTHCTDEDDVLAEVRVSTLQGAGHHQHRLDGAQAVVVVALLRQLLRRQLVQLGHLARQVAGIVEAFGEQHDLGDECIVWHHHGHGPEEHLQVVRQWGTPGVAASKQEQLCQSQDRRWQHTSSHTYPGFIVMMTWCSFNAMSRPLNTMCSAPINRPRRST